MKDLNNAVSFLFVPGDRPERFEKAVRSGADVVIVDLEDAVSQTNKAAARSAVLEEWESLSAIANETNVTPCIRINALREEVARHDVALCHLLKPSLVMVPKVESRDDLSIIAREVPDAGVLALIESATGVLEARAIATAPNVARLVLGSVDLMLNLGVTNDREPLDASRSMLVLASASAGIGAPVDGVCTSITDLDLVKADTERARSFGFAAKLCIHPKQIAAVAAAFSVSDEEFAWASEVVAASKASAGAATTVNGAMIDLPVLLRALRIVARRNEAAQAATSS
ncbi:CoA ester lyase [Paraburkholderia sp. CNPSo 3281]|uniref:HpcH/HpaI aldolase/citrate lyase family protein n=1 Tax=Paraburkholderia sp. CNPSo 3281 TaxID=2940933 RepID=UPI0020B7719C|nr:CoA ester lyase [Paraburkholderia sp. CNPSo 3281]MCP3720988.1 CoA ester lyase [Paraburkholderia sp. CNPSo 3281]